MYHEINEQLAARARATWSFSTYTAGSATAEYRSMVDRMASLCERLEGEEKEKALAYVERYAKTLAGQINRGFSIDLQCPSVMITGASNFPVAKKERQNKAREKLYKEMADTQEYYERKISGVGMGSAIIKSGDETAVEQLQAKVAELEEKQRFMKAANAHWRKHKTMAHFEGITEEAAVKMDEDIKDDLWQCPYPTYALTNNNQGLKRYKDRLASLEKVKAQENTELETETHKVVRNTEIMRLQLFFDGKPESDTRTLLKQNGFKWAPSQNAWQRQLTNNAMLAYNRIKDKI